MEVDLTSVMILLALQGLALGWRIAREVDGKEPRPFPWVPVPDNVNVLSMLAVAALCVISPLTAVGVRVHSVGVLARATFAAATVLIVAHPLVVASHYGLWRGARRGGDEQVRYCPPQEAIVQIVALVIAGIVFVTVIQTVSAPTVLLPPP